MTKKVNTHFRFNLTSGPVALNFTLIMPGSVGKLEAVERAKQIFKEHTDGELSISSAYVNAPDLIAATLLVDPSKITVDCISSRKTKNAT